MGISRALPRVGRGTGLSWSESVRAWADAPSATFGSVAAAGLYVLILLAGTTGVASAVVACSLIVAVGLFLAQPWWFGFSLAGAVLVLIPFSIATGFPDYGTLTLVLPCFSLMSVIRVMFMGEPSSG